MLSVLRKNFSYNPTPSQDKAIRQFPAFIYSGKKRVLWLIKGSAGTGKTSLIQAFTRALEEKRFPYVLLAPTGRAAKVMTAYTGRQAGTIHKEIYHAAAYGGNTFRLKENRRSPGTVFILDEASMIQDQAVNPVLKDLLQYVYSAENSKLILLGDEAQLPPVGYATGPALDKDYLERRYGLRVGVSELTETVRQRIHSRILKNAVTLRQSLYSNEKFYWKTDPEEVILPGDAYEMQELLYATFEGEQASNALIITRSNKRANRYNQQIRRHVRGAEEIVLAGDVMMVVKNNYHYHPVKGNFIANGDRLVIGRIYNILHRYGFHFAEAEVIWEDTEGEPMTADAVLWLDAIESESPALGEDAYRQLYEKIAESMDKPLKSKILQHPFFNAIQVKFAYAVTAHKAQGGQWDTVFIEKPYAVDEKDITYKRWLYTALTRAVHKVCLVGFTAEDCQN